MPEWNKINQLDLLKKFCFSSRERKNIKKMFDLHSENQNPWTYDYQYMFNCLNRDTLAITPTKNLCKNIGFERDDATHNKGHNPFMFPLEDLISPIISPLQIKRDRKFIIVRFGNVAGSKGSVIPIFQKLINQRLDLLVTNKKATRYLMSIREASGLIIKASIFGSNSKIYVLDMGEPINIYTLAYNMIKFNGLSLKDKNNIHGDISIKIIGLRKGEKLHEKLSYKNNLIKTKYNKILLCDEEILSSNFKLKLSKYLSKLNKTSNKSILKEEINKLF